MSLSKVQRGQNVRESVELEPGTYSTKIDKEGMNPHTLLEDLKAKQALFATLKEKGLIHHNRHAVMEIQLRETIAELEDLIPQLEVS